jgi:hypothetical protein
VVELEDADHTVRMRDDTDKACLHLKDFTETCGVRYVKAVNRPCWKAIS